MRLAHKGVAQEADPDLPVACAHRARYYEPS
jgi:hypothetical protein